MTIEEAIDHLDECITRLRAAGCEECALEHEQLRAWLLELADFRARQEVEKNEPLTLEELRRMDGEPVWAESLFEGEVVSSGWAIPCAKMGHLDQRFDGPMFYEKYGADWLAYRRPPEKEENNDED